jgi:hypothetical protein
VIVEQIARQGDIRRSAADTANHEHRRSLFRLDRDESIHALDARGELLRTKKSSAR